MALLYESHSHTPLCRHAIGEPEAYAGRPGMCTGLECDYLPGLEGYWADFLSRAGAGKELSCVLGSIHPHTPGYRQLYWTDHLLAYQKLYFQHLAQAAETRRLCGRSSRC